MSLAGKGMWIWQIPRCEGGDPDRIADVASASGFTHVVVKVANGILAYNVDRATKKDLCPPVVEALRAKGIQVWGWHYIYGYNPIGEADIAIQRTKQLNLDGYVIDAELEYKQPGMDKKALIFMKKLRPAIPYTPIALSSYRYPKYHPELPWKEFLTYCNYNMPQVYWEQGTNSRAQLERSLREFAAITPHREYIPTGSFYKTGGWVPTANQMIDFLNTAKANGLKAANFYVWNQKAYLQDQWKAIADYPWNSPTQPEDIAKRFIATLNSHNPALVVSLYNPRAVHITAKETLQGTQKIKNYYANLFEKWMPDGIFTLKSYSGAANTRTIIWQAESSKHIIREGRDTMGIIGGKFSYHYSFYKIEEK